MPQEQKLVPREKIEAEKQALQTLMTEYLSDFTVWLSMIQDGMPPTEALSWEISFG